WLLVSWYGSTAGRSTTGSVILTASAWHSGQSFGLFGCQCRGSCSLVRCHHRRIRRRTGFHHACTNAIPKRRMIHRSIRTFHLLLDASCKTPGPLWSRALFRQGCGPFTRRLDLSTV